MTTAYNSRPENQTGFKVIKPGALALIQDNGRVGQHRLGLTTGGPLDPEAFYWANTLLGNPENSSTIELSLGGLVLKAQTDTFISVCGAPMPLTINGKKQPLWMVHAIKQGDTIQLGFTSRGLRTYIAVKNGFSIIPILGSTATVMREKVGGLDHHGSSLNAGDILPCANITSTADNQYLPETLQPVYNRHVLLRTMPGYQQHLFSREQQRKFFSSYYRVSEHCDRMGFRLNGNAIKPDKAENKNSMLSEGISLGSIQIPADGQPIILLNDRQTIGGYPKIGTVLSIDLAKLSQLTPGCTVNFEAISLEKAHKIRKETLKKRLAIEPLSNGLIQHK